MSFMSIECYICEMSCLGNVKTIRCSKASLPCGNQYQSCQQKYLNWILKTEVNVSFL